MRNSEILMTAIRRCWYTDTFNKEAVRLVQESAHPPSRTGFEDSREHIVSLAQRSSEVIGWDESSFVLDPNYTRLGLPIKT